MRQWISEKPVRWLSIGMIAYESYSWRRKEEGSEVAVRKFEDLAEKQFKSLEVLWGLCQLRRCCGSQVKGKVLP